MRHAFAYRKNQTLIFLKNLENNSKKSKLRIKNWKIQKILTKT